MTRVVLYLRMSDSKQETSLADQRAACRKYAKSHGLQIVGEYVDEGISGDATERRAEFQRMIRDAETGKFQGILCWSQDRFGRFDHLEAGYWIKPLRDRGIFLETVDHGRIDWNDFASRLVYTVQQESKHQYLRDLARNVLRGMISAALAGKPLAAPPRGYAVESGKIVVTEDAEIVRQIFGLYLSGLSCREVAEHLNASGVKPLRASLWTRTTVYQCLTNEYYCGVYVWNSRSEAKYSEVLNGSVVSVRPGPAKFRVKTEDAVRIEGHHPAIIDQDIFDRAQALLATRRKQTAPKRAGFTFALSGLLTCGECGAPMHGRRSGRTRVPYYVCSKSIHSAGCRSNAVPESEVCAAIVEAIQREFSSDIKSAEFAAQVRRKLEQQAPQDIDRRLATLRQKLERAKLRMTECDRDLLPIVQAQVRKLMAEESELARAAQEQAAARAAIINLDERVRELQAGALSGLDPSREPDQFRRKMRRLLDGVKVYAETDPKHASRFVLSRVEVAFSVGAVLNVAASRLEQECVSVSALGKKPRRP